APDQRGVAEHPEVGAGALGAPVGQGRRHHGRAVAKRGGQRPGWRHGHCLQCWVFRFTITTGAFCMATQDNEPEQRVVSVLLITLIGLIIAGVLGLGVFKVLGDKGASTPAVAPASGAAAAGGAGGAAASADAAGGVSANDPSVVVDNGVVKF